MWEKTANKTKCVKTIAKSHFHANLLKNGVQWVRVLAAKVDKPSPVPRTHAVEE